MRRTCLFIITGGLVLAGGFASGARAAGANAPPSAPGTPSATPTVMPSPTPTRTARPKAVKLVRASLQAMATVRQVHAEGILTDGFGAKHAAQITADCDSQPQATLEQTKAHLLIQAKDEHGVPFGIDVIIVEGRLWTRIHSGSAPWSDWKEFKGDALTYVLVGLSFYLAQSCPQQFIVKDDRSVPPHLKNLGPALVDGVPTWHLRTHGKSQGEPVVFNFYVDQTTYFLRRVAGSQIAPKKKDTFIENTQYSRFNEPVDIEPPAVAPSPTQAPAMSRHMQRAGVRGGVRSRQWMPLHRK